MTYASPSIRRPAVIAEQHRTIVLMELARGDLITSSQLAKLVGASVRTIYRCIAELKDRGHPIEGASGYGYVMRKRKAKMELDLTPEAQAAIDKVQKLLALANNNPNEHEAAVASAKAMEILAAHNLDMAIIDAKAGNKGAARNDKYLKGGLYQWQRELWDAVAKLNFCRYWYVKGNTRGSTYQHRLLGSHVNVVSAQVMAEYLQQTVERLAQTYAKERGMNVFCREMIAYREGMSDRLWTRLTELRHERIREDERKKREAEQRNREAGASSSTALVLADVIQSEEDLNNDYLQGWEPGTTARRRAEEQAAWQKRMDAAKVAREKAEREREEAERLNPELKQKRLAAEAAQQEAYRKEEEKRRKREERNEKRRKGDGYRYRAETAREKRQGLGTYWEGQRQGDKVSLNKQIDEREQRRLS